MKPFQVTCAGPGCSNRVYGLMDPVSCELGLPAPWRSDEVLWHFCSLECELLAEGTRVTLGMPARTFPLGGPRNCSQEPQK